MRHDAKPIEAKGLVVSLGGRRVLDGLDAGAAPGRLTAVVGPNGAGKSTLLRTLARLITPDAGIVRLDGREIGDWDRRALARRLAFLPQDRRVHWPMAVRAVVALGRLPHRGIGAAPSRADEEAVSAAMNAMDVTAMADRPVSTLSGGELALVLLARALAQQGDILLADEPTAGLDPAHQLTLFGHFKTLAEQRACVIVALHDLTLAARFCDEIWLLSGAKLLAAGAPADVLTPELLAAAYGIEARVGEVGGLPVVLAVRNLSD